MQVVYIFVASLYALHPHCFRSDKPYQQEIFYSCFYTRSSYLVVLLLLFYVGDIQSPSITDIHYSQWLFPCSTFLCTISNFFPTVLLISSMPHIVSLAHYYVFSDAPSQLVLYILITSVLLFPLFV